MSHDINADPEVWAMRHQVGEKALSIWLEFLSIADRNGGELPGDSEELIRLVAGRCQATKRTVTAVYHFAISRLWLNSQPTLRVVKYSKYHRTEEQYPRPTDPTGPDLTKPKDTISSISDEDNEISVKDFVESWNEVFKGRLPQVEWPLSKTRHHKCACRLKEHSGLDFWQRVFGNIGKSQFLLGRSNGRNWACTLDFLIANDTNCVKIYEGSYK